jgi:GT2 family glycosyltransferase
VTATTPLITIVTPVFNPPVDALTRCIESVRAQTRPDWQWCLCDDASTDPEVVAILEGLAQSDSRVLLHRRDANGGIVAASNDALASATGEFVALLDHDDLLFPQALERVGAVLESSADIDYLYTDEDKCSPSGQHYDVFRKPQWSPERLRSQMYTGHLGVLRRALVLEVGGFRAGFEGSQDHDLVLRVTERARRIVHVPEVLYSWAVVPGSAAGDIGAKPYAFEAGRRAVEDHCSRTGIDGHVEFLPGPAVYRLRRRIHGQPLVSVVIPTRGTSGRVWGQERAFVTEIVRDLVTRTDYQNIEVVIVYDLDTPESVLTDLETLCGDRLVAVPFTAPFNFSAKVNLGYLKSHGEYVLILNDDMEVIDEDWMTTLVALAQEPDVGVVGAKLLFSDGTVQHAGHHYAHGDAYHVLYRAEGDSTGYFNSLVVQREASGVTGACMMMRRSVYQEVGGMTELLPGSFNDVDFCLKVTRAGYRILWTPFASLYHFESKSRDPRVTAEEADFLHSRWGLEWPHDPYLADDARSSMLSSTTRRRIVGLLPRRLRPHARRVRDKLTRR